MAPISWALLNNGNADTKKDLKKVDKKIRHITRRDAKLFAELGFRRTKLNVIRPNPLLGYLLANGKYWDEFKNRFGLQEKQQIKGDMFGLDAWQSSVALAMAQCQEYFCDFIGLLIFRQSYLYAFAYLLAPWGLPRVEGHYPSIKYRITALIDASIAYKIIIPEQYKELFDNGSDESSESKIEDEVAVEFISELIDLAQQFMTSRSLVSQNEDVDRIIHDFTRGIPATGAKDIASILNAGWQLRDNGENPWHVRKSDPGKQIEFETTSESDGWHKTLNELMLKSFEVFEVERRQEQKCLIVQPSLNL